MEAGVGELMEEVGCWSVASTIAQGFSVEPQGGASGLNTLIPIRMAAPAVTRSRDYK